MSVSKSIKGCFLKFFTNKKTSDFNLKDTKKILFLRYDRLGDMVITTPVFRELKLAYPNIEISVLASQANKDILTNNPYVDKVYTNHKNEFFKDYKVLKQLSKEKFDAAVEFDHSVIPHAILRLKIINPKKIISVYKDGRYNVKGTDLKMYDYFTNKDLMKRHFRDIWLDTLSFFDIEAKSKKYDLFITQNQEKTANDFIQNLKPKKLIGINLEGAVKGKKIERNELQEICEGIYKNAKNIHIIILHTPNKTDEVNDIIKDMSLDYVIPSYKTDTILDLAALVKVLDLVITPDTSIVHIASAFDRPIVSIHENNMSSYTFFAPTSTVNYTVFAKSQNGLEGYSVEDIVKYSVECINMKGLHE